MSEQTLLEQAAEVRERRAALGRTVQELKQLKGDWTQFELAASDAMRIADDGLRNAWQMLDRLNQFGKAEIGKLAAPNDRGQRGAACGASAAPRGYACGERRHESRHE